MKAALTLDVSGLDGRAVRALLTLGALLSNGNGPDFDEAMELLYEIGFALDAIDLPAWFASDSLGRDKLHDAVVTLGREMRILADLDSEATEVIDA